MLPKLRAYAELLRVSNVLTAVSNVWMGMIVTTGGMPDAWISAPLTLASVCLYLSGMVLNDFFDAEKDAGERPGRPIPSGRVARWEAGVLGFGLMAAGVAAAGVLAFVARSHVPLVDAAALAGLVLLYDGVANRSQSEDTAALLMGACRGANVILGMHAMTLLDPEALPRGFTFVAVGVTVYVAGVTMFARREVERSRRRALALPVAGAAAGVLCVAGAPFVLSRAAMPAAPAAQWCLLWAVVLLFIGRRFALALLQPQPKHIQAAVGNAIQGIILIDAALATGYAGAYWGLAILALLPPTMLMARLIPQT